MAKQDECTKCTKCKKGGFSGEVRCSFYGRTLQFDDQPCPHFSAEDLQRCPECGQEVPKTAATCPQCGYPLKPATTSKTKMPGNFALLNTGAEPIINKYGNVIKIIGLVLMIVLFILAVYMLFLFFKHDRSEFLISSILYIVYGIVVYLICVVIKAFIDVFVNISVTLQNIDSKIKGDS